MSKRDNEIGGLVEPHRVHRDVYLDPEIFELEMKRIWGRAWIYVGHESQVRKPGDFITTTIGTEPVVMARDKTGAVHVMINRCGHKGAKVVAQASGSTPMFRCPYHGWSYQLDGRLNVIPHDTGYDETGLDRNDPQFSMPTVARMESYRGFVFASLASDGPDLATFLGATPADHRQRLRPLAGRTG